MEFIGRDITINAEYVRSRFAPTLTGAPYEAFLAIREEVLAVAKPSLLHTRCDVSHLQGGAADLCGFRFDGPLINYCMSEAEVAYPYVLTLGADIDELVRSKESSFEMYIADLMANVLLRSAKNAFERNLKETYHHEVLSRISPGSVDLWPIEVQRVLFALLSQVGDVPVHLEESCIMNPLKSISGIYYPSTSRFTTCSVCSRKDCIGREREYDAVLEASIRHHAARL